MARDVTRSKFDRTRTANQGWGSGRSFMPSLSHLPFPEEYVPVIENMKQTSLSLIRTGFAPFYPIVKFSPLEAGRIRIVDQHTVNFKYRK
jgi:hypothetical protein